MIRVGLVGLGGISSSHISGYRDLSNIKVVAAADILGEKAMHYADAVDLGAKVYDNVDDMLANEELDMLDVMVPTFCHLEIIEKGLSRGLHVLSEKPMARTSAQCERILDLASKTEKKCMIAHCVRFDKAYLCLRSLVNSGELGKPIHFILNRIGSVPRWSVNDWMQDGKLSGGVPLDLSIHDIDFIYSVFGEPKDISATYRPFTGKDSEGLNEFLSANLIYDGFCATVTGSQYNTDVRFGATFLAVFENGCLEYRDGKLFKNNEEIILDDISPKEATGINVPPSSMYGSEIAYFADCIENGTSPDFVTLESSTGSVKLVERIVAAANKL
ncbi:MAG: Gfo/Idh/MocA family oxidoreductase [Clostridia bacterium]|nr:Gfo/Idh/MocA family oxidoreductase [Clostridia bacterium]